MKYAVSADIRYLDGTLAGLVIPSGFNVTVPDRQHAARTSAWIERVRKDGDFARAAGTGKRYEFVSAPRVDELRPIVA